MVKRNEQLVLESVQKVIEEGAANAMMRGLNMWLENSMSSMMHNVSQELQRR